MPTTEPLDPGDDAEGRLKPIAEFAEGPTTGTAPRAATPAAAAAVPVGRPARANGAGATVQTPPTSGGVATGAPRPAAGARVVGLRTPGVGLRGSLHKEQPEQAAPVKGEHVARTTPFTPDDLVREWRKFIDSNASEHLLVNAMRAATPRPLHDSVYMVTQSEVHIALIRENQERLTSYLRHALDNDSVGLELTVVSEDSPLAWNDREFVNHIIADNPGLAEFIDILKLSLS